MSTADNHTQQVLPQPVFHELREAVNTNCWLDWDQVGVYFCAVCALSVF